jgi:hypothetical protein
MNAIQEAAARMKKAIAEPCSISIDLTHWFHGEGRESMAWKASVHVEGTCKLHCGRSLAELVTVVCAFHGTPDFSTQQNEEAELLEAIK